MTKTMYVMRKIISTAAITLLMVLLVSFENLAQVHRAHVASQGGGVSTGGEYTQFSVFGAEPVESNLSGGEYRGQAGFLYKSFEGFLPQYVIKGNVITPEGKALAKGLIALLKDVDGAKTQIASTVLSSTGAFNFPEIYAGSYTLKVIPAEDTSAGLALLTTFLGGVQLPHVATVFALQRDSLFSNITVLREQAPDSTWLGSASISGILVEGDGSTQGRNSLTSELNANAGTPMANAQVFLTDPATKEIKFTTLTDTEGLFAFDSIASTTYGFMVEYEGKTFEMADSIDVTAESPSIEVTAIVSGGEMSTSVKVVTASKEDTKNSFLLYPNPVQEKLSLKITGLSSGPLEINVYDTQGKLLRTKQVTVGGNSLNEEIDLSELPRGLYLVLVKQRDYVNHSKIIKQ
jgi:hypothetical protein